MRWRSSTVESVFDSVRVSRILSSTASSQTISESMGPHLFPLRESEKGNISKSM